MIKLFNSTETDFSSLGLGNLTDATSCVVKEERNGTFELILSYPIDGIHYSDIKLRSLIVCKSNPFSKEQAFRVYYISKPIKGIVTINAEHISYDMSGMVVSPCSAENAAAALIALKNNSIPSCPFNFTTDKEVQAKFTIKTPSSLRAMLGGTEGSILDIYGTGEYEFDNYNVSFRTHRGTDRGVTLRYGKNLTDLTQEENCTKVYTAVYPYWAGTYYENDTETEVLVTLPEKTVAVEGTFDFDRILSLDMSEYFENQPTEDQLRTATQNYITNNDIGKPEVSLKVSFLQLEQAEEYEQLKLLESVYLCDTVTVIFPELGVNSTAKCITTEYNVITDKYISLELGSSQTNLANTIVNQQEEIANVPTASFMDQEIEKATKMITGGLGGYVIMHSSSGQKKPDEILILDEKSGGDYTKADKIWRWNKEGLGFSETGYEGPYKNFAVTSDGTLLASQVAAEGIQAGTIEAAITLISPTIQNSEKDPSFYVNSSGKVYGANIEGSTITSKNGDRSVTISGGSLTINNDANSFFQLNHGDGHLALGGKHFAAYNNSVYYGNYESIYIGKAAMEAGAGSDERLKKDIEYIPVDLSKNLITRTKPISFKYKDEKFGTKTRFGVIAQELRDTMNDIGLDDCELEYIRHDKYHTVEYKEFIAHLINCINDLYSEIDKLRKEIK